MSKDARFRREWLRPAKAQSRAILSLPALLILAATVLAATLALPKQALAQENVMNWRASLPQMQAQPGLETPIYRPRRRIETPRASGDSDLAAPLPRSDASLIAILGDSLAEALHSGFEGDARLKSGYRLLARTSSASGLVRDDHFSWPKALAGLLAEQREIAALVILIGLNDRQPIRAGESAHEPLGDAWREEYRQRVDAILALTRDAKVPVFWVGLPPMRSPKLSQDLAAITTLIRERVAIFGQNFIDIGDAFADGSGGFSATGPDVIGDVVRLRGPDGIHFTPAGQRKLAFFVDQALARLPGERAPPAIADPPAPAEAALSGVAPSLPAPPALPVPLRLPSILPPGANTVLGGIVIPPPRPPIGETRPVSPARQADRLIEGPGPGSGGLMSRNLFDRGLAPAPRPGRSDDYGWR